MDRKQVQKERIKRYFLDAAKIIIRTEGISNLTTKKIGEKAAYSYASIYNYFENFNDLCCQCLEEMAADCAAWVKDHLRGDTPLERILHFARLMIEANAAEPNVYSPFLSTEIDFSYFQKRDGRHFIHPAYEILMTELEKLPSPSDTSGRGEARILADILTYVFHSKLHFYIQYGTPSSLEQLQKEVREEALYILNRSIGA